MNVIPFTHKMAAHCESGTVTALLNHVGLSISEPMVFGIASGIFFGYFNKQPSFAFPTFIVRNKPGHIRKNLAKELGIGFFMETYKNAKEGEQALDKLLEQNIPVAVQVDFFYMEYIPEWQRAHINVHFLTVIGKEGDDYFVSDSYYPEIARINRHSLNKGRFALGTMAPKGFMFYPNNIPKQPDFEKAIKAGIKKAAKNMLKIPLPFLGIKGIRMFAKKIVDWPERARDIEHLSHEIMKINILLEDQGTGGAGFRFVYASFLKEASEILHSNELNQMAGRMMKIGDNWREISVFAAKIGKKRDLGKDRLKELGDMLLQRAEEEKAFFTELVAFI